MKFFFFLHCQRIKLVRNTCKASFLFFVWYSLRCYGGRRWFLVWCWKIMTLVPDFLFVPHSSVIFFWFVETAKELIIERKDRDTFKLIFFIFGVYNYFVVGIFPELVEIIVFLGQGITFGKLWIWGSTVVSSTDAATSRKHNVLLRPKT